MQIRIKRDDMSATIAKYFLRSKHPLIITGAGISTDSHIPDYRGKKGAYVTNPAFKPITAQHFMAKHQHRQRYWLRSYLGWNTINNAIPNDSHFNVTRLEYLGANIITQNVDALHSKAGSNALELHGTLYKVECQSCKSVIDRNQYQKELAALNPELHAFKWQNRVNPDGDAQLELESFDFMQIPQCNNCGGVMKPKVVFFGENMDIPTRKHADALLNTSDFLLVIGSTLTTYSAFRFLHHLAAQHHFTASISLGNSRGNNMFTLSLNQQPMHTILPNSVKHIMNEKQKYLFKKVIQISYHLIWHLIYILLFYFQLCLQHYPLFLSLVVLFHWLCL